MNGASKKRIANKKVAAKLTQEGKLEPENSATDSSRLFYLAMKVTRTAISHQQIENKIPFELCWAKGMIGVVPCFETRKDAEAYRGGALDIIVVKEKKLNPKDIRQLKRPATLSPK